MKWHIAVCALWAACAAQEYFLPRAVLPRHYELRLLYDIDPTTNFTYFAVVDILLTAKKPTSQIVLHAKDINIPADGITLQSEDEPPKTMQYKFNETFDFLIVDLDENIQPEKKYTLTIKFQGNLRAGQDGAYISSYADKDGKKHYLVTTQFEAISARKAFPCFDEPMYKATFSQSLGHHKDFSAVSNMPLADSTEDNLIEAHWPWATVSKQFNKDIKEFVWDRFEKSVPMSTYLVAFVISKFGYVQSPKGLSTTAFKIWARKEALYQTEYAASVGPRVLSHFEKFFNVSFPLPKQDMIAIPDFQIGLVAMENWGLVTYKETALLHDKEESSSLNKERVAETIGHELAHQWFGNLVTMKWWSDLWLNEGFATFVASIGVKEVEPTWHFDQTHAVDNIMGFMDLDALESSHPVSATIDDPKRISEIFDEISYKKASTLIRMMTMFLGEDVFRRAMHNYLIKYSYSNAEQDDLWAELTSASREYGGLTRNVSVKEVMDTWTTQTGYPLLTVTRDYSDTTLTVTQKRYLNSDAKSKTAVSWWIPLTVMCESEVGKPAEPVQWLSDTEGVNSKHHFEHSAKPHEWVLFNHDMIAPYRVNYDKPNWQLLISTLNSDQFEQIPVLGRVQLLSDAFALAWTDRLDYSTALQLPKYLQRETEFPPLFTGLGALDKINRVMKRTAEYGAFQKFMRHLIGERYEKAGGLSQKKMLNGDDPSSLKIQVLMSKLACRVRVPGCLENAVEMFQSWMEMRDPDKHNPIPLDLRQIVYCAAIERGSVREWRFMLARKQRANVAAARDAALAALTCTQEVWILNQYLEWTITDNSEVRRQDSFQVILNSDVGYYVAKQFIYTHIKDIHAAFGGIHMMGRLVGFLLNQFTSQYEMDEFMTWYRANEQYFLGAELSMNQAIEEANRNIDWLKRNLKLTNFAVLSEDADDRKTSRSDSDLSDLTPRAREGGRSDSNSLQNNKLLLINVFLVPFFYYI